MHLALEKQNLVAVAFHSWVWVYIKKRKPHIMAHWPIRPSLPPFLQVSASPSLLLLPKILLLPSFCSCSLPRYKRYLMMIYPIFSFQMMLSSLLRQAAPNRHIRTGSKHHDIYMSIDLI